MNRHTLENWASSSDRHSECGTRVLGDVSNLVSARKATHDGMNDWNVSGNQNTLQIAPSVSLARKPCFSIAKYTRPAGHVFGGQNIPFASHCRHLLSPVGTTHLVLRSRQLEQAMLALCRVFGDLSLELSIFSCCWSPCSCAMVTRLPRVNVVVVGSCIRD